MTRNLHPTCIAIFAVLSGLIMDVPEASAQTDLFISEYVEGSSNNKCIEIFNPTANPVNLSFYSLNFHNDGNPNPSFSTPLSGTIQPKSTFVVCHSGAETSAAQQNFYQIANYNGNDAIVLMKNNSPVDIFGNIGCDPGDSWSGGGNNTQNMTLVRKPCVVDGITNNPGSNCSFPTLSTEWLRYPEDDFSNLGFHNFLSPALNVSTVSPSDCGEDDGSLTILANGNGLEYTIDGTSFTASNIFLGLTAGNYQVVVRVKDDHSCAVSSLVMISEPAQPAITGIDASDPTDCGVGNGAIEITASGPVLEYSIDNGLNFQSNPHFQNLSAGRYDIVVRTTGTVGCLASDQVTLNAPTNPNISSINTVPASDCNVGDGQITINASPSGLQYSIDNGMTWSTNRTFTNLSPGSYDILVRKTASPSCQDNGTADITAPEPPTVSLDYITPVHCKGYSTGSIALNTSGGSGSYLYQWSGPAEIDDTDNPRNLPAGYYSVTVSDAVAPGCRDVLTGLQVTEPLTDPPVPELDVPPAWCQSHSPLSLPEEQDGISGTWSGTGVTNNFFDPDRLEGSYILTFSPDADQCAKSNTAMIEVESPVIPVLTYFGPICSTDPPFDLPASQGEIAGHWSGMGVVDNRLYPENLSGDIVLTFIPTDDYCAEPAQTSILVNQARTPELQPLGNFCQNENPVPLSPTQDEIHGSWSGPGVDGDHFYPDRATGKITLVFEADLGQCAHDATRKLEVFPLKTPRLEPLPDICQGDAPVDLPNFQDNILGNWSGMGVHQNLFDPSGLSGTVTLTFIPISNQCAREVSGEIVIGSPPQVEFQKLDPRCAGAANGQITISVTGGQGPYLFDWNLDGSGDFDDHQDLSDAPSGEHTLMVKDQKSCLSSMVIKLDDPPLLYLRLTSEPESFLNALDGSAEVSARGGTPPYDYQWSNGRTTSSVTGLAPGTYRVTVTDDNSCMQSGEITVPAGDCQLDISLTKEDNRCFGTSGGHLKVSATKGILPLTYRWSHDSTLNQPELSHVVAGTYSVTVEDAAGCQVVSWLEISEPDTLITGLTTIPQPGSNTVTITAMTSGGTAPYKYHWSNGSMDKIQQGQLSGDYSVTTTDAQGCEHIAWVSIDETDCSLEIDLRPTDVSCSGFADGTIEAMVNGGNEPYTFVWNHNPDINGPVISGLSAGAYALTVIGAGGCRAEQSAVINTPSILQIDAGIHHPDPKGSISTTVTGGTAPYQWTWSTGESGADLSFLDAGIYTLTVTDSRGCQQTESFQLVQIACDLEAMVETRPVSCEGDEDGSAQISVISGKAPFNVIWEHDTSLHLLAAEGLSAGNYQVTVVDADDCQLELPFEITSPEALRIAFDAKDETRPGAKDGSISITPIGGTPPYFYYWNSGHDVDSAGNLKPGTYIITLEDSHGCRDVRSTMINPANCTLVSNVGVRPVGCHGDSTGRARLDITTLAFPVDIRWSHDTTIRSNVVEKLPAGYYQVTITDEDQCSHIWPFTVTQPDSITFEAEVSHQSVAGLEDGSIQLTIFGGTPDYHVEWNNGRQSDRIENLLPGLYSFTVTDANGCIKTDSVEVLSSETCLLQVSINAQPAGCTTNNGKIEITTAFEKGEVTYRWSHPDMGDSAIVMNLSSGSYWVEVADDYCLVRDTIDIVINEIRGVSYNLKQSLCTAGVTRLEIGSVTGGKPPYLFYLDGQLWDPSSEGSLEGGSHTLQVTDAEGCEYEEAFHVTPADFIRVMEDVEIKRGQELQLTATIAGNTGQLQYHWRSKEGILCQQCTIWTINPEASGRYLFEVTDPDGCKFSDEVQVTVSEQKLYYIPNAFTPNQDGINDGFQVYDVHNLIEEIVSLEIFDRRGVKIFTASHFPSNEEITDFSDTMSQAIAPQVYMYLMRVRFRQGYERQIKGDFILLR
jgi:hypothetical protein